MSNIEILLIGALLGALAEILVERLIRWAAREIAFSRLLSLFRRTMAQNAPARFVDVVSDIKVGKRELHFHTLRDLAGFLSAEVCAGRRVFLVTGSYGIGKSFCCSVVAGLLAKRFLPFRSLIPCVVDSTHFLVEPAEQNLLAGVNRALGWQPPQPQPATDSIVSRLLRTPRFVLFLDALDQLPFAEGVQSAMGPLLKMLSAHACAPTRSAVLVAVVREEFLRHNSELKDLQQDDHVCVVSFNRGFDQDQIRRYGELFTPSEIQSRVQKVLQITEAADPAIRENARRPVLIESLFKAPLADLLELSCSGTTMANIYAIRYKRFPTSVCSTLKQLGFYLYSRSLFAAPLQPGFYYTSRLRLEELTAASQTTEALVLTRTDVRFAHATLRDYFAAVFIVSSLEQVATDQELRCPTTFLLSEMVATLLDEKTLDHLIMAGLSSNNTIVKGNVCDFLSEMEKPALIAKAHGYFDRELEAHRSEPMSEYKLELLVNAGALGNESAINEVLKYYEKVGFADFREMYFVTKDHYFYYNRKEDVAITEWINILRQPKYHFLRRLVAVLLRELSVDSPPEVLLEIADNDKETDLELRKLARQSYDLILARITGEQDRKDSTAAPVEPADPGWSATSD